MRVQLGATLKFPVHHVTEGFKGPTIEKKVQIRLYAQGKYVICRFVNGDILISHVNADILIPRVQTAHCTPGELMHFHGTFEKEAFFTAYIGCIDCEK